MDEEEVLGVRRSQVVIVDGKVDDSDTRPRELKKGY